MEDADQLRPVICKPAMCTECGFLSYSIGVLRRSFAFAGMKIRHGRAVVWATYEKSRHRTSSTNYTAKYLWLSVSQRSEECHAGL